ncbi:tail fiber assembly protein [Sodalis glossinidius]|uniref:tail fiber assembly protein n=1 Tax=Sodalis glossinidius TaxID=63612 RepID=UPI00141286D4|nr:tail fiber assembly protein [Sodalis glossinidius]
MKNYAVIEDAVVTNFVVWDGKSEWRPEKGKAVLASEGVGIGWKYVNGGFKRPDTPSLPHKEYVALAEQEKVSLLNNARQKILVWQVKLAIGKKLTDIEISQLNLWLDYIDLLISVDTSTAPNVN